MSVIFGIKEKNKIVIAGDKRGSSSLDDRILSDDLQKIIVVNKHLAFASAGNAGFALAIQMEVKKIVM